MSPRLGTGSSQLRFIAWLHLGISKTSKSSSPLRLLYSSGRVASGKTQLRADLGLYHLGNPKARTPSGQVQIMLENHHPAPAQLILHSGQWSQPTLAADWPGKIPPIDLTTATKAHLQEEGVLSPQKGAPQVPSLGDRGGCAIGPYKTPTLGHATKHRV